MEYKAKYYLVDIDGTITDYLPEALEKRHEWIGSNFLFPIFRDLMVERGDDPDEAVKRILEIQSTVPYWDYTDFIEALELPRVEAYRRMKQWHKDNLYCYPETIELLKKLHGMGKKLFIMSNNPYTGCLMKLEAAGLADSFSAPLFERIFGTNLLRGCKSNDGVWARAIAQIPAPSSEIGTIGDNPVEDGEIPKSYGIGEAIIIPRKVIARGIDQNKGGKA